MRLRAGCTHVRAGCVQPRHQRYLHYLPLLLAKLERQWLEFQGQRPSAWLQRRGFHREKVSRVVRVGEYGAIFLKMLPYCVRHQVLQTARKIRGLSLVKRCFFKPTGNGVALTARLTRDAGSQGDMSREVPQCFSPDHGCYCGRRSPSTVGSPNGAPVPAAPGALVAAGPAWHGRASSLLDIGLGAVAMMNPAAWPGPCAMHPLCRAPPKACRILIFRSQRRSRALAPPRFRFAWRWEIDVALTCAGTRTSVEAARPPEKMRHR